MRRLGLVTVVCLLAWMCFWAGCKSPGAYRRDADKVASSIIQEKQKQTLGTTQPFTIERPADTLRRRLMIAQDLPHAGPASLGTQDLDPVKHWPKDDYLKNAFGPADPFAAKASDKPIKLSLFDTLQVAARNSREYQARKEEIYQTALDLDLARDEFRLFFTGNVSGDITRDLAEGNPNTSAYATPGLGLTQRLANGAVISSNIALNLAKMLTYDHSATLGLAADASIAVPLLRGGGEWVVTEPLTQAERNVAYDLLSFEQYKRTFVVNVASQYLSVVQQIDQLQNAEDSYRRLILAASQARWLSAAGRLAAFQVDQADQEELNARERWIGARQSYARTLDAFKVLIGLPPDARIELDRDELKRLANTTEQHIGSLAPETRPAITSQPATTTRPAARAASTQSTTLPTTQIASGPPTTLPTNLVEPDPRGGPYELPPLEAVRLALENRPDLRVARGQVFDAQRHVAVVANALEAALNVNAGARAGGGAPGPQGNPPDTQLRFDHGRYNAGFDLDLPLHRTAERDAYRASIINLEKATRSFQQLEDDIKLTITNRLRDLLEAREGVRTQTQALEIAERRVNSTDLLILAGRAQVRDVLDSQAALINAQNAFTSALVRYRVAELQMQRDLGLLDVNQEGLWREYSPKSTRR